MYYTSKKGTRFAPGQDRQLSCRDCRPGPVGRSHMRFGVMIRNDCAERQTRKAYRPNRRGLKAPSEDLSVAGVRRQQDQNPQHTLPVYRIRDGWGEIAINQRRQATLGAAAPKYLR